MTVWEERLVPLRERLDNLSDELACFDYLVKCCREAGWEPDEGLRQTDNLVPGCDSRMWVKLSYRPDGSVQILADSDSMLLRGMLMLLTKLYAGTLPPVPCEPGILLIEHPRIADCFSKKQLATLKTLCQRIHHEL